MPSFLPGQNEHLVPELADGFLVCISSDTPIVGTGGGGVTYSERARIAARIAELEYLASALRDSPLYVSDLHSTSAELNARDPQETQAPGPADSEPATPAAEIDDWPFDQIFEYSFTPVWFSAPGAYAAKLLSLLPIRRSALCYAPYIAVQNATPTWAVLSLDDWAESSMLCRAADLVCGCSTTHFTPLFTNHSSPLVQDYRAGLLRLIEGILSALRLMLVLLLAALTNQSRAITFCLVMLAAIRHSSRRGEPDHYLPVFALSPDLPRGVVRLAA